MSKKKKKGELWRDRVDMARHEGRAGTQMALSSPPILLILQREKSASIVKTTRRNGLTRSLGCRHLFFFYTSHPIPYSRKRKMALSVQTDKP